MKCSYCRKGKTEVINSRKGKSDHEVWRRRKCPKCNEVFTTKEVFSYDSWFVVKRNLTRKRFLYEKLFVSVLNAISTGKGRDQGDDALSAKKLTEVVLFRLFELKSKYFSTKDVIRITHAVLEKENTFFALRYAMYSKYRSQTIKPQS